MSAGGFGEAAFAGTSAWGRHVRALVLARAPADRPVSILDIGCGDGASLLALAEALPDANLSGLDPSAPNVARARERIEAAGPDLGARLRIWHGRLGDAGPDGPFDIVILDSVLYILPGATDRVAADLARLVAPGGLLVHNTPADTVRNRRLVGARRILARLRGPLMDRLVLALARLLHGRHWSTEQLRERVFYAYVVPVRLDGPAVRDALQRHGFACLESHAVAAVSPAQLEHRLSAWRRMPVEATQGHGGAQ